MPPDYTRAAPAASAAKVAQSLARSIGLLTLRLVTGGALLFWHGWSQGRSAWSHIWQKTPWDLPGVLAAMGFPLSLALAFALVLIVLLSASFLMIGLLTRLSALLLASLAIIASALYHAYPGIAETAVLYAGAGLTSACCGPGAFAVDRALRALATKRPRP